MRKVTFPFKGTLKTSDLNQRFADLASGSILQGFRLKKGTGFYSVSIARDGAAESILLTKKGVRLVDEGDAIDAIRISPNTSTQDRYDVVYVIHDPYDATFYYEAVEGISGESVKLIQNPELRTAIGHVRVRPNQTLTQTDLTAYPLGLRIGTSLFEKVADFIEGIKTKTLEIDGKKAASEEFATSQAASKANTALTDAKAYADTQLNAAKTYTTTQLNALVAGAPGTLDTLKEIADALGNDAQLSSKVIETRTEVMNARGTFASLKERMDLQKYYVNVKEFGAKGDGVTDDTAAVQNALAASNKIFFPPEGTYCLGEIVLPAKDVYIFGAKSNIKGISGTFIFKQRKRSWLTAMESLDFTGNSSAFFYDSDDASLPNHGQRYEYLIKDCRFLQAMPLPAVNLYGVREGILDACYFESNAGIMTEFAINTVLSDCHFKNCLYNVFSKLGSEGLIISNMVALGSNKGIWCERTTGVQITNSMIDYCDIPIYLKGATDVIITGNYVSTRTENPAIQTTKYNDGFLGSKYIIANNNLRTNSVNGEVVAKLEDIYDGVFSNNILSNYGVDGLQYGNVTQFSIFGNVIRNRSGAGVASINALASGDSSTVTMRFNNVTKPIVRTARNYLLNAGFLTQSKGEAVIANGQSTVVVTHGLSITPLKMDVMLTPTTPNTKDLNYYVSDITATTFTITVSPAVASTTAFAWSVSA